MFYAQSQWLLFFFIYCFLGWVWESCYVSVRKREWINRGFLHGPILPIYGFGAIIILWLTLPVQYSLILIFLFGMIGATLLEYATGFVMERLFHVRYWDYSNCRFNVNGYICLFATLGWGVFSILLVKVLHPPIERIVLQIPIYLSDPISLVCVIIFIVDTTKSVQSALDLKDLLSKLTESNHALSSVEAGLEAAISSLTNGSRKFYTHILEMNTEIQKARTQYELKRAAAQESSRAFLLEKLRERRNKKSHLLSLLNEKAAAAIAEINELMEHSSLPQEQKHLSSLLVQIQSFQAQIKKFEVDMTARKNKEYEQAVKLIRRNPGASSTRFRESLMELKRLAEKQIKDQKHK